MPIEIKSSRVTEPDILNQLPEIPSLPTLTEKERADLKEWWKLVQDVLERKFDQ